MELPSNDIPVAIQYEPVRPRPALSMLRLFKLVIGSLAIAGAGLLLIVVAVKFK